MARTVTEIQDQIITEKATHAELNGLSSPSQTAIWRLWTYIVAVAISVHEQILDVFKIDIETLVAAAPPSTAKYLKSKAINYFQYDATTPQVLVSDASTNFVPTYPVINPDLRIISRCSVKTQAGKIVEIKVATGEPPAALSVPQKAAVVSFFDEFMPPGISYSIISDAADKIYVKATINYDGAYKTIIETAVKAALTQFYADLSSLDAFDGVLKVSDIENVIKDVTGVTDVKIEKVYGRADGTVFASATKVYDLSLSVNLQVYEMSAGYGVEETTAGYTLNDSLTFVID